MKADIETTVDALHDGKKREYQKFRVKVLLLNCPREI